MNSVIELITKSNDKSVFKIVLIILALLLPFSLLCYTYTSYIQSLNLVNITALFIVSTGPVLLMSISGRFYIAEIFKNMNIKLNEKLVSVEEALSKHITHNKNIKDVKDLEQSKTKLRKFVAKNKRDINKLDHPERDFILTLSVDMINIQLCITVITLPFINTINKNVSINVYILMLLVTYVAYQILSILYQKIKVTLYLAKVEKDTKKIVGSSKYLS
jgi:hypothetical protein